MSVKTWGFMSVRCCTVTLEFMVSPRSAMTPRRKGKGLADEGAACQRALAHSWDCMLGPWHVWTQGERFRAKTMQCMAGLCAGAMQPVTTQGCVCSAESAWVIRLRGTGQHSCRAAQAAGLRF